MIGSAFSKPEEKKNLIPESSLPMGGDTKDTLDSGPHIQSAAPESSTAALAAGVPLEKKRQAMVIDPADAPQTDATTVSGVPETVKESLAEAHQSPEAASSAEAVKEKSAMEQELLKKTAVSEATGDSGATSATQTSYYGLATQVPETVEKSMQEAHAPPEAAADSSAVAEKSAMEAELLKKIPSSEEAGEPAPTIAAATSETAPTATTDAPSGLSTDEKIAGGAVGGMATAGVVAGLVSGTDKEPAPTSEPFSGTAPVGSTDAPAPTTDSLSKPEAVEHFQEDPTLADEPAVKMMQQDEAEGDIGTEATVAQDATTTETSPAAPSTAAPTAITSTKAEKTLGAVVAGTTTAPSGGTITSPSASSTPVKKTAAADTSSPASSATKEKKKRNRLSRAWHKLVD
jgi:hypothetical protein